MKKLLVIIMCSIIVSAPQSVNVSADSIPNDEIINCQYENANGLMSSDVIQYKYRKYNKRIQYRRCNATRKYWVHPYCIYA